MSEFTSLQRNHCTRVKRRMLGVRCCNQISDSGSIATQDRNFSYALTYVRLVREIVRRSMAFMDNSEQLSFNKAHSWYPEFDDKCWNLALFPNSESLWGPNNADTVSSFISTISLLLSKFCLHRDFETLEENNEILLYCALKIVKWMLLEFSNKQLHNAD